MAPRMLISFNLLENQIATLAQTETTQNPLVMFSLNLAQTWSQWIRLVLVILHRAHHTVNICGFEWNVSATIWLTVVTSGSDIHVHSRMTCDNFGDLNSCSSTSFKSNFEMVWYSVFCDQIMPISTFYNLCGVLNRKYWHVDMNVNVSIPVNIKRILNSVCGC